MELTTLLIVIATYFVASFYGSIAGGAAILTVPVLIFTGISPHTAIGTHKIGAIGIGLGGSAGYKEERKLENRLLFFLALIAAIGSVMGSILVLSIAEGAVRKIIGVIMILICVIMLIDRKTGIKTTKAKISKPLLSAYSFISGAYYGFYAAGIGVINRFVFSKFFSFSILSSSAVSTLFSLVTGIITFLIFGFFGKVDYSLFAPIILASTLGAYAGAKYSIKIGNEKVKIILMATSVIMAVKLLFF